MQNYRKVNAPGKLLNESGLLMNEMGVSGGIDNSEISYFKTSKRSLGVLALSPLREFFFHAETAKNYAAEFFIGRFGVLV